ncbi:MAG: bifunctional diaminohydroxyphosphoribosylaminopyrimidine deaminase/5-amino-6-(5-phosphoribosylamino)uracil reductase RibD [Boseongicola sp.]|nr:bifunctional diaminohydroxyphosphoribosylaminopyrimidine deaminase/5-amino-6-(5-phosphoribosylamino)uracil reductase RibD [Boseongicola sp.]
MAHALALGRRGLGRVWPNPAVGCVIVLDGRTVGRGWTGDRGMPHAEPRALAQAGEAARGATSYVSLEPCAHAGRTPPCVEALIEAGVARVVVPIEDPDRRVSGRGIERLREAGLTVDVGLLAGAAREAHAGFLLRVTEGRPLVTLKLAVTLDGRIATATGESQWITGEEARRVSHALRLSHDAVMVGAGTIRIDDPKLTVRGMGAVGQPVRIVVGGSKTLPSQCRLMQRIEEAGPVWLVHGEGAREDAVWWKLAGANLVPVPASQGQVDVASLMQNLGTRGLTRVLCEGGGTLSASLLSAGWVDQLVVFSAGKVLGAEGKPSVGTFGISQLSMAPEFELMEVRRVGADIMHVWRRSNAG